MSAKELIRANLDAAMGFLLTLAEDMKDAPLVFPTPKGGNHTMWVIGHLAYSEGGIIQEMMLGKPNPLAEWSEIFANGTEPVGDAATYPPFGEVLGKMKQVHKANLEFFDSLSEKDLDTPSENAPPEYVHIFGTYGLCFQMIANHVWMHYGQIADARRADGRKRLAS